MLSAGNRTGRYSWTGRQAKPPIFIILLLFFIILFSILGFVRYSEFGRLPCPTVHPRLNTRHKTRTLRKPWTPLLNRGCPDCPTYPYYRTLRGGAGEERAKRVTYCCGCVLPVCAYAAGLAARLLLRGVVCARDSRLFPIYRLGFRQGMRFGLYP